ncbi:MAG: hypothetical protein GVY21_08250 [Gammaproteobacteria bacterium]|jgi:predicted lipid-binding transport protein (Tim44 family)|nr:hypothetical protein [Gammaproteobacteria bacterium]
MTDDKRKSGGQTSGLLGDLESIRSLLEEAEPADRDTASGDEASARKASGIGSSSGEATDAASGDDDVPLLEDVVHGGVSVNETFFSGEGDFQDSAEASGLNEDVFKALLSDEWRESARELLDQARDAIEQHQTEWTPTHTDELNEALKVRMDETLQQWLREALASRVDELRHTLLTALSDEIQRTIDRQFGDQPRRTPEEDPDGE